MFDTHVDQRTFLADPPPVEDVEFRLLERRGHLVLDDLRPGSVTDRIGAVLEGLDPAHIDANGRVELQSLTARCRFGRIVHHDAIDEVVVITFDFDVEAIHRPGVRLDVDIEDSRRHQPLAGLHELRCHSAESAEPRKQLVFHRRGHVRGHDLLELRRGCCGEHQNGLTPRSRVTQSDVQTVDISQVVTQALAGARAHCFHTDLDPAAAALGALLKPLGPHRESAVIHVPDSQRQRRQRLEIVLGQDFLAVPEIDGAAQLAQLGQRGEVGEPRPLVVLADRVLDIAQQIHLPLQVVDLFGAVAHPEAHPVAIMQIG